MPQDRRDGRRSGHRLCVRAAVRTSTAAALGLVLGLSATVAEAQTAGSDTDGVWNRLMRSVGVQSAPSPSSDIDYMERPPLVVPPTRDLPPPSDQPGQTAAWPRGSAKSTKHVRAANEVVPDTAVQNPNPPVQKKPWYNPAGWFSKEEYASFNGEPVRHDLTEPPAGYRIPSAGQPYGISPDKKGYQQLSTIPGMAPIGGGQSSK
jgi:hypothetical protein